MKIDLGPAIKWAGYHRIEILLVTVILAVAVLLAWATSVANDQECDEFMAFARTPADSLQALTNCRMVQAERVPDVVPVAVPR